LLLFLLFVTFINYFLLLRRARVYIVFIVRGGERVSLYLFILISFVVEREAWRLMFFFLLHLTCARRRGRGVSFFRKVFFSLLND
jgi:hypothetical protein